jgi:hypothetical protein
MYTISRRLSFRKSFELVERTDIRSNHSVSTHCASRGAAYFPALPGGAMPKGLVFA